MTEDVPGEEYRELEEYAEHLRASGEVSELSIYQRLGYLKRLREVYDRPITELEATEIEGWLASLNLAPSSRKTVLTYLRHALKVLNGGDAPELSKRLPRPRKGGTSRVKTPDELLTEREVRDLAGAFTEKDLSAITALLYGLGARPGDVLGLKRSQLKTGERQRDGKPYLEAQIPDSKGRPRVAYTAKPWVVRAVEEWLKAHPGGDLLFPSPRGGERTPGAFREALKRAAEAVGIEKRVYPYLLRHTRATELYDLAAPVRDAQMGWVAGSDMWANYTHLKTEDVRDAILDREGEAREITPEQVNEQVIGALLEALEDPDKAAQVREALRGI